MKFHNICVTEEVKIPLKKSCHQLYTDANIHLVLHTCLILMTCYEHLRCTSMYSIKLHMNTEPHEYMCHHLNVSQILWMVQQDICMSQILLPHLCRRQDFIRIGTSHTSVVRCQRHYESVATLAFNLHHTDLHVSCLDQSFFLCMYRGADTFKLLTVYSDHIPSRGHQYNRRKWEVWEGVRQVEENKEMKQNERDKKTVEEKKIISFKIEKGPLSLSNSTSFPHERSPFCYDSPIF